MCSKNEDLSVKVLNLLWSYQQLSDLMPVDDSGARLLLMLNAEFEKLSVQLIDSLADQPSLPIVSLQSNKTATM